MTVIVEHITGGGWDCDTVGVFTDFQLAAVAVAKHYDVRDSGSFEDESGSIRYYLTDGSVVVVRPFEFNRLAV
jgi:hypothetical protein